MAKLLTACICIAIPLAMGGCAAMGVLAAPFSFIGALVSGGDGEKKPNKEKLAEADPQKMVGTIRFSYEGFVLIYSPTNETIRPGTPLTTLNKEGIAQNVVLRMSSERKGPFLVADIVEGNPKSGHLVVTQAGGAFPSRSDYQVLE